MSEATEPAVVYAPKPRYEVQLGESETVATRIDSQGTHHFQSNVTWSFHCRVDYFDIAQELADELSGENKYVQVIDHEGGMTHVYSDDS